jgi:predicted MPP superfamily phosphohydrolase
MKFGGFAIFLSVFLTLYGGMHYYIYKKIAPLVPSLHASIVVLFALLVVSPIIIQLMINTNWISAARIVARIGYLWMGFVVVFFSFALINDALRGALWFCSKIFHLDTALLPVLSSPHVTVALIVTALTACGYGAYAATQIHFTRVSFPTPKFTAGHAPFRIVQITDLHLGLLTDEARIQRMVADINALRPDLIVSTGDLVDMQTDHISKFAPTLRKLHATHGCYAVTGNHEAFAGIDGALAFTRDSGFTVLSSDGKQIAQRVNLVGVDDPAVLRSADSKPAPEANVLQQFNNGLVTVLLKHQPVINDASTPYIDLQLSGHVHGGQIFPFGFFTWLAYRVHMGMTQAAPTTWLYVSYGSGTWGPPIRFLAPSEITVIDIVPANKPSPLSPEA